MARRMYDNDYPSVTTVLGVLRKIALENWYKFNTAKFCNEESNKGKIIGTQIHEAIHQYIETNKLKAETQYAEEVTIALKSFVKFRKKFPHIILQNAEIALTSEKYKFNGTIDCISDTIILDWKTGKCKEKEKPPIYDEYKYQVAAYVKLWNEAKGADIDKAIIVAIAKDKVAFNTYEMDKQEIEDCFDEVFLSCLKISRYQKGAKNGRQ